MSMLWMDSVRSLRYQAVNTIVRRTANAAVVVSSGTPMLSVRLSLTRVPTTLIRATAVQYTPGR
ncbi:hypothetical protein QF026_005656 [Streptomyces aurantiacus]|nr:hypothetical protein [Streptomyces aurantiacus]